MNPEAHSDTSNNINERQEFSFQQDNIDSLRIGLVVYSRLLGKKTSVAELGDGFALAKGKLQTKDIPQALKRVGLSAKIIQRRAESLQNMLLPALLVLKDHSALILVNYEQGKATLVVPETAGTIELTTEELEQQCSGTIVIAKAEYSPDKRAHNFAKKEETHWLKSRLKACWPTYAEVGVASLIANCLTISTSLFALQVYDRVVPNDAFDTLFVLASGVVIAIILDFILRLLRSFLLDGVGKKLDLEVSSLLFNQVLQVRLAAKPPSTGAFSSQVREFEGVREFFTSSTAATISDFPFIFIFIGIIAYLGGPIAWVPIIAMLLMLLPGLVMQGRLAELSRENLREGAVKHGLLLEVVENLESVKATSAEGRNLALWDSISAKLAEDSIKFKKLSSFLQFGASMVQQLCYVFVVIVGVYQISAGDLTVGGLIACTMLAARTISPVNQMSGILARWQHVKVSLEGLDELMNAPVERPANRSFVRKDKLQGNYQLENTRVRYSSDAPYALNVNKLNIKAGSRIIVLGSNGAGKSTLLKALAGLEDVTEGRLIVDDVLLSQIEPVDRKRWIGYLPQDTSLFYGTLRDNLLLNGAHFEDEVLLEVLNVVGLGSAIKQHPLGLDLPIFGSRSLSGGQRQSVGLARLILQDPKIVLLDEPTASLDQVTEEKVISFLAVWLKGRTLIMSTHKRKLLKLGERGVVLDNGVVTMDGPFEDLIKKQA